MNPTGTEHLFGLSSAFERLADHADRWCPSRLMDEGLDIARDAAWADSVALLARRDDQMVQLGTRPLHQVDAGGPMTWFPWGLAPVNPRRFLLIADARALRFASSGRSTFEDLGIRSAMHMPLVERGQPIGALQLHWKAPRLAWDDERGPLLRLLGRFLIDHGVDRLPAVESA